MSELIHHVKDKDDFQACLKEAGAKLVVVDFHATWCGPCKQISPRLEEMAQQMMADVVFLKVDVDDVEEVASDFDISCMPTFILLKNSEKDDFQACLKEAGAKLVVVDFHATWCGPCKQISPRLEEMAQQMMADVVFLKVDVDDVEEVASDFDISCMPTFILLKNSEKVDSFSGANAEKLKEMIEKNK